MRREKKRFLVFDYVRFVLMALAVFFLFSLVGNLRRLRLIRKEIESATHGLSVLQGENASLKDEIERIGSGEYQEAQIRDRFGLSKEGEMVLVLPEPEVLRRLSPRRGQDAKKNVESVPWREWWELFYEG